MTFHKNILNIDPAAVTEILVADIRATLRQFRRSGAVVGISGGVDSSTVLALCVRALGPKRVVGIMMPEKDSSPDSLELATKLADQFGIPEWALSGIPARERQHCPVMVGRR